MGVLLQSEGGALGSLLSTLLALVAIAALAYVGLRWLAAKGFGTGRGGEHVQVLERVPLDFKNALYVVRASGRTWLIGTGERGAPRLLTELPSNSPAPPIPTHE